MSAERQFRSARDVMETNVVFIDPMATARETVELMKKHRVECLFVKKRDDRDSYGIVSKQDLIKGVILPERTADEIHVFEIMTKPVISVPPSMDIRLVARLLIRTGFWLAPVEEDGEYIGLISLATMVLDEIFF